MLQSSNEELPFQNIINLLQFKGSEMINVAEIAAGLRKSTTLTTLKVLIVVLSHVLLVFLNKAKKIKSPSLDARFEVLFHALKENSSLTTLQLFVPFLFHLIHTVQA